MVLSGDKKPYTSVLAGCIMLASAVEAQHTPSFTAQTQYLRTSESGFIVMPMSSTPINSHADRLLSVLTESSWLTRKQIARRLDKHRLNPSNISMLERLSTQGLVEIQQRANDTFIGYEYVYRLAGD